MNFLRDTENFLEEDRVNQWPDRRDRAMRVRRKQGSSKICRPDRYVPEVQESDYRYSL